MSNHTPTRAPGVLLAATALVMASCGGDDAGSADRLSDDAFCERIEQIALETAQLPDDQAEAEFFDRLGELTAAAPNDEMRSALTKFGEFARALDDIDENDPDAIGEAFAIVFDPEFMAAGGALEQYTTDVCGFDDDMFGDGDGFETDTDMEMEMDVEIDVEIDVDTDTSADAAGSGSGSGSGSDVVTELLRDPSTLRDRIATAVEGPFGMGVDPNFGDPLIRVSLEPDLQQSPMAACLDVGRMVDGYPGTDGFGLEITNPTGDLLVVRATAGECQLVGGDASDDEAGSAAADSGTPDYDGVFDALRASDVINGPVGLVTGLVVPGTFTTMVGVDIERGQNPDPVAVCDEVARILDELTGVTGLAIEIGTTRGNDVLAERPTGGTCQTP